MAKTSNRNTRIYLDEYDISGFLNATELKLDQETMRVESFADAGPRRVVGNYDHSGSHTGFFDAAEGGLDPLVFGDFATDEEHYVTQLFGAYAEGSLGYDRVVRLKDQPRKSGVGQAMLLNFSEEGSGNLARCTVLRSAAVTGTGNGTGRSLGTSTSGQIFAVVFRVLAVSGSGSITVKVQESSDNGVGDAYADITGLTNTFTAIGVARKTTTAATEAYKRVSVSALSGFTSVTLLVTAGIVAGS